MLYDPNWEAPTVKLEAWQQLLLDAANIIEEHGWIKYKFHRPGAGYCMVGAIRKAAYGDPENIDMLFINGKFRHTESYRRAFAAVANTIGRPDITAFNDDVAKNKSVVIAALRKAAHVV